MTFERAAVQWSQIENMSSELCIFKTFEHLVDKINELQEAIETLTSDTK